jgi:hypothetical protein
MMQFMRKSSNSSTPRKRSQRVDARPPNYFVSAAQAEVQISEELRDAAAKIVKQIDERESSESEQAVEKGAERRADAEPSPGSTLEFAAIGSEGDRRVGRSKANPRVIHLRI